MNIPYRYIAIEGNIGTGKTTLCKIISNELKNAHLILEQFTDNPFLENFYTNPKRFALQVELFFLSERYKQLKAIQIESDLFDTKYISDYAFVKTLLFAAQNLTGDELHLFRRIYKMVSINIPEPEIIFFIHRPVDELLKLIEKRNRSYERNIQAEYLRNIQNAYFQYFENLAENPVVIIDSKGLDFESNPRDRSYLFDILQTQFSVKTHFISPENSTLFD